MRIAFDPVRVLALTLIRFYQRFISPYKGFRCAYRAKTGAASCSSLGYRAIRRYGAFFGSAVVRKRLRRCGAVHRQGAYALGRGHYQHGACDLGCDLPIAPSCDLPDIPCSRFAGDLMTCGCDWPSSGKDRPSKRADRIKVTAVIDGLTGPPLKHMATLHVALEHVADALGFHVIEGRDDAGFYVALFLRLEAMDTTLTLLRRRGQRVDRIDVWANTSDAAWRKGIEHLASGLGIAGAQVEWVVVQPEAVR